MNPEAHRAVSRGLESGLHADRSDDVLDSLSKRRVALFDDGTIRLEREDADARELGDEHCTILCATLDLNHFYREWCRGAGHDRSEVGKWRGARRIVGKEQDPVALRARDECGVVVWGELDRCGVLDVEDSLQRLHRAILLQREGRDAVVVHRAAKQVHISEQYVLPIT